MAIENFEFDLLKHNGVVSIGVQKGGGSMIITSPERSPLLDEAVKTVKDPDLNMAIIKSRFVLDECPHCGSIEICAGAETNGTFEGEPASIIHHCLFKRQAFWIRG